MAADMDDTHGCHPCSDLCGCSRRCVHDAMAAVTDHHCHCLLLLQARVDPRTGSPVVATVITGTIVGLLAFFVPLIVLADLVSMGTLFAFMIVCISVAVRARYSTGGTTPKWRCHPALRLGHHGVVPDRLPVLLQGPLWHHHCRSGAVCDWHRAVLHPACGVQADGFCRAPEPHPALPGSSGKHLPDR